jgi:hypothetical protein
MVEFNKEADEANIKLNNELDNDSRPYRSKSGKTNSITETNLKIQNAFYHDSNDEDVIPTYVTNETAAIKITEDRNKI